MQNKNNINGKKLICTLLIVMVISIIYGYRVYNNYEKDSPMNIEVEDFKIVVATDLHYLTKRLNDNGSKFQQIINSADGKETQFSPEILNVFIYETLKEKPDAVVLTGDLTFNGEKLSHVDLSDRLSELTDAGIKVLAFPGNHDTNNPHAVKYSGDSYEKVETINSKKFAEIYNDFGLSEAISLDKASNSFVYELQEKVWLICVDMNTDNNENVVLDRTFDWLEKVLKDAKKQGIKIISFTHQNLFLHNNSFQKGFKIENSQKLVKLYEDYNVNFNLSGHMHIQHIQTNRSITEIATSALTVWPYQYGIISYNDGKLSYDTRKLDLERWVEYNNITDKNIIAFVEEESKFFDELTYDKTYEVLSNYNISEVEKKEMVEYFVRLNREYFIGKLNNETDVDSSKARKLWEENAGDSFLYYYIKSIEKEEYIDQNSFQRDW